VTGSLQHGCRCACQGARRLPLLAGHSCSADSAQRLRSCSRALLCELLAPGHEPHLVMWCRRWLTPAVWNTARHLFLVSLSCRAAPHPAARDGSCHSPPGPRQGAQPCAASTAAALTSCQAHSVQRLQQCPFDAHASTATALTSCQAHSVQRLQQCPFDAHASTATALTSCKPGRCTAAAVPLWCSQSAT
jgi:hypothetical protein